MRERGYSTFIFSSKGPNKFMKIFITPCRLSDWSYNLVVYKLDFVFPQLITVSPWIVWIQIVGSHYSAINLLVQKYSMYLTSKIALILSLTHMLLMIQIVWFWIERCTFWTKMYAILGFTVFQKEYKIWTVNFSSIFHWNFVLLSLWKIELLTSVYYTGFSIKV